MPLAIYSSNVRSWISLAMIDEADLTYGDEVELWGEPDGGSANPLVERHTTQTTIRAVIERRPFPAD